MKLSKYTQAVLWIAENDECSVMNLEEIMNSVTVLLVAKAGIKI